MAEASVLQPQPLPVGSKGRLSSGWWGMWAVVGTELALFAYLLFSYYYIAAQAHAPWPPDGPPHVGTAVVETVLLLAGSVTVWWGERGVRAGRKRPLVLGLAATLVLGVVFLSLQGLEWRAKTFTPATHVYGSLYFTITGFHMAHVVAGLVMLAALLVWSTLGYFGKPRHSAVSIGAIYWHFVTAVWLAVFFTFYVSPYLA